MDIEVIRNFEVKGRVENLLMKKKILKLDKLKKYCVIFVLNALMLVQVYNLQPIFLQLPLGKFTQFIPLLLNNFLFVLTSMIFGYVFSKKRFYPANLFIFWLLTVVTLLLLYLINLLRFPADFKIWQFLRIFFPIITSASTLIAGVVFSLLVQPYILLLQKNLTTKQNILLLTILTLVGYALTAGNYFLNYSIYSLYLILYFAWGMLIAKIHIPNKVFKWMLLLGIISLGIMIVGVPGFNGVNWYHRLSGHGALNWNFGFLSNITSPFLVFIALDLVIGFKSLLKEFTRKDLEFLVPSIVIMQSSISVKLFNSFYFTSNVLLNLMIIFLICLLLNYCLVIFFEQKILKAPFCSKIINSKQGILQLLSKVIWIGKQWLTNHRVGLFTFVWLLLLSYGSFLMQSDRLRIQALNISRINAVTYLLANKLGAIVLTSIFLGALFLIINIVTTRYWTSIILVTILTLGWSVANKVKINLRGTAISPSDLNEVANLKSLLSMIDSKFVMILLTILILAIILDLFLEFRFPIKNKYSWKVKGWSLLFSILLFMTPLYFNHKGTFIYYINRGFDNTPSLINSSEDSQFNGPVLTFLDYVDLKPVNKPAGYSKNAIQKIANKYNKEAIEINKKRKNLLSRQTIVFNLSESFVDPYTFPTIKISSATPNPVKFIQSLERRTTYGNMLSAGYGGGTADMEWESLTGFNMGMFKTNVTPFVRIVPQFEFYPTIGMNFDYKSVIHPFIGTYYSRIEDYKKFGFNKFVYAGSKYKLIKQQKIGNSPYNSDFTAYANGLKQINSRVGGQFINLISIQNHMPYKNWYPNNEYINGFKGKMFKDSDIKQQMASYIKGIRYTDQAVCKFIRQIDQINKPITLVFYGDHYPSIISQKYTSQYPIQLHSTRYFIYSNKYARKHGAIEKLVGKTRYVNTSDFIALLLQQTSCKVTPYQALLTRIHEELPAITVDYKKNQGLEFVSQKGKRISNKALNSKQKNLLQDYEKVQYDMTDGHAYTLKMRNFYK